MGATSGHSSNRYWHLDGCVGRLYTEQMRRETRRFDSCSVPKSTPP